MSQPVPPSWKDLGKASNDLLNKDYPIHGTSLEVKTLTPNNVAFKVLGVRDNKTNAIKGDLEAKWTDKKGITITQGWTTSNVLLSKVELDNQVAKGLKLELDTSLIPDKADKRAIVGAHYKQPGLHARSFLDLFKGPTFTADAVLGRDGFLVGAEASYDVRDGKVSRYNAAVGFHAPEYAVTLHGLGNLSTYAASYYHRVSADVEAGAKAVYDTKAPTPAVALEVGTKTYLDNSAFVKAKINNAGVLALGYTQALRPGVKASFGLALDTLKLSDAAASANAHKAGLSVTFEG